MVDPQKIRAETIADNVVDEILALIRSDQDWEPFGETDGIVGKKFDQPDGNRRVKCITTINKPYQQVFQFIWKCDNKRKWISDILQIRSVKNFDFTCRIIHEEIDAPWPVSNRDFVFVERYYERENGILICNKSIDGVLDEIDGNIRGEVILRGIYLKKISANVTEFTLVSIVNPGGSLPTFIINMKTENVINSIETLRNLI